MLLRHRTAVLTGLLGALAAALPTRSVAQQPAPVASAPTDSALAALLRERVATARAPGIVVGLVGADGRRRFLADGTARAGAAAPVDERTVFEVGSTTKTFTALALAVLAERGTLRVDEPVEGAYRGAVRVPSRDGAAVTYERLATHRAGLPRLPDDLAPRDMADPYADYDVARLHAFLARHELARTPGTTVEYSNLGFGLLGDALVRAGGARSYADLLARTVTGPLRLGDTWVDVPAAARARLATGHDQTMEPVPAWHLTDAMAGAGALRSTAADMLAYAAAWLDAAPTAGAAPRTVRDTLRRAMAAARAPRAAMPSAPGDSIALAWIVTHAGDDRRPLWWHNGGTGGFRSFVGFDPARRAAVVVLANSAVSVDDIGLHLLDATRPLAAPRVPPRRATVALPAAALDRVAGAYALAPTFVLTVTREAAPDGEARAYLQATGQPRVRLWPAAPDRFFLREVDAELRFELPADGGPATAVTLRQNGRDQRAPRQP
jgi:CubicO group peptidase (beta-lactamase class C family)